MRLRHGSTDKISQAFKRAIVQEDEGAEKDVADN